MNNRRAHNRSQAPIIFICSQFGGSLVKELFYSSSPQRTKRAEIREFHSYIRGFAFFSTPHSQRHIDEVSPNQLQAMTEISTVDMDMFFQDKYLQKLHLKILLINDDFRDSEGEQIQSICFYNAGNADLFGTVSLITPCKVAF